MLNALLSNERVKDCYFHGGVSTVKDLAGGNKYYVQEIEGQAQETVNAPSPEGRSRVLREMM